MNIWKIKNSLCKNGTGKRIGIVAYCRNAIATKAIPLSQVVSQMDRIEYYSSPTNTPFNDQLFDTEILFLILYAITMLPVFSFHLVFVFTFSIKEIEVILQPFLTSSITCVATQLLSVKVLLLFIGLHWTKKPFMVGVMLLMNKCPI